MVIHKSFFLLLLAFFYACDQDFLSTPPPVIAKYIFLGHIYEKANTIDPRVAEIDLSRYDQIWLGGDICSETTREPSTLVYLDSIFDLSSSKTHWTLGNHDLRNGHQEWITQRTRKPAFYAANFNNITLLVLNTNFNHRDTVYCDQINQQFELITSVCDTIQGSSHLVLMGHHVVWGELHEKMKIEEFANSNDYWQLFQCDPDGRFEDVVYPLLVQVQNRGVQVICIAGDLGQKAISFDLKTNEGVQFLGSGITAEITYNQRFPTHGHPDKILIIQHDLSNKKISWEFRELPLKPL